MLFDYKGYDIGSNDHSSYYNNHNSTDYRCNPTNYALPTNLYDIKYQGLSCLPNQSGNYSIGLYHTQAWQIELS